MAAMVIELGDSARSTLHEVPGVRAARSLAAEDRRPCRRAEVRCRRRASAVLRLRQLPEVRFTSWQRPLPQVCPQCGGLIVGDRGRRAKCTNCDWKGPTSQAKERAPAGAA
jgi:ssDNA-binding Zn-finger/Zn-ribbon topoisomerase 1